MAEDTNGPISYRRASALRGGRRRSRKGSSSRRRARARPLPMLARLSCTAWQSRVAPPIPVLPATGTVTLQPWKDGRAAVRRSAGSGDDDLGEANVLHGRIAAARPQRWVGEEGLEFVERTLKARLAHVLEYHADPLPDNQIAVVTRARRRNDGQAAGEVFPVLDRGAGPLGRRLDSEGKAHVRRGEVRRHLVARHGANDAGHPLCRRAVGEASRGLGREDEQRDLTQCATRRCREFDDQIPPVPAAELPRIGEHRPAQAQRRAQRVALCSSRMKWEVSTAQGNTSTSIRARAAISARRPSLSTATACAERRLRSSAHKVRRWATDSRAQIPASTYSCESGPSASSKKAVRVSRAAADAMTAGTVPRP